MKVELIRFASGEEKRMKKWEMKEERISFQPRKRKVVKENFSPFYYLSAIMFEWIFVELVETIRRRRNEG